MNEHPKYYFLWTEINAGIQLRITLDGYFLSDDLLTILDVVMNLEIEESISIKTITRFIKWRDLNRVLGVVKCMRIWRNYYRTATWSQYIS